MECKKKKKKKRARDPSVRTGEWRRVIYMVKEWVNEYDYWVIIVNHMSMETENLSSTV